VLVIDDYEGGRLALCACLSEVGCDAFGAASDIVRRELDWCALFDVIIANDDPPWADGARVVRQLRRHAPDLPAIVMNHVVTRHDDDAIETPSGVLLVQPVPLDQLARAIDRVAQRWPVLG
jgi:DNA-binding NarL/FixJ family response regulator